MATISQIPITEDYQSFIHGILSANNYFNNDKELITNPFSSAVASYVKFISSVANRYMRCPYIYYNVSDTADNEVDMVEMLPLVKLDNYIDDVSSSDSYLLGSKQYFYVFTSNASGSVYLKELTNFTTYTRQDFITNFIDKGWYFYNRFAGATRFYNGNVDASLGTTRTLTSRGIQFMNTNGDVGAIEYGLFDPFIVNQPVIPSIFKYTLEQDEVFYVIASNSALENIEGVTSGITYASCFVMVKPSFIHKIFEPLGIAVATTIEEATSTPISEFGMWNSYSPEPETNPTPYSAGGTTTPSIGDTSGSWTRTIDTIDGNPSGYNDLAANLFRVYALSKQQLGDFANNLWNPNVLQAIGQHFSNPTDIVIGLHSFPFIVPHNTYQESIQFNWIPAWLDGVSCSGYKVNQEYYTVDFGTIEVKRYSGTFYDYHPYSSAQLYLPYVGFVNLKVNEIVGGKLNVKYNINIITGDFIANVFATDRVDAITGETYDMMIASFNGNMARPLPISRQDMLEVYKAGIELVRSVAETAIAGAPAAASNLSSIADYASNMQSWSRTNSYNEWYNNTYIPQMARTYGSNWAPEPKVNDPKPELKLTPINDATRKGLSHAANAASNVASSNAPISRSGSLSSIFGRCTEQTPFLLMSYPHQNVTESQPMLGYATNLDGTLENFSGYTEVRDIRLNLPTATSQEIAEIEQLVRGGIII